jgi:hypothetical protein
MVRALTKMTGKAAENNIVWSGRRENDSNYPG